MSTTRFKRKSNLPTKKKSPTSKNKNNKNSKNNKKTKLIGNNGSAYFLQLIKDNHLVQKNGKNGKKILHTGKLTPSVQKNVLEAINLGMPIEPACHLVGVANVTYYNWLKWGKEEASHISELLDKAIEEISKQGHLDTTNHIEMEEFIEVFMKAQRPNKFFKFLIAIEAAKAEGHARALQSIKKATEGGKYLSEIKIKKDKDGNDIEEVHIDKYMKPDWNAGAWYLERKFPDLYSQKTIQENTGIGAGLNFNAPVQINVRLVKNDE